MAYRTTKRYEKNETIILSFDIGTTHSAVSFSHAYPGEFPSVRSVVKWPGQPEASGDSKIPTIVAYQGGEAKSFGAEARDQLDDDEYEIARWFKLHAHPESMKSRQSSMDLDQLEIPPLPSGVSLSQVYADFIRYIYKATKEFFVNNTPNGQHIWGRLESSIPIIFCTPNGWDISEYAFLTEATVRAGIVDQADAEDRLWFITEGEASVHYSLAHTETATWLKADTIFAVTDAGGSTVDSTLYRCRNEKPLILEEVCASVCVQAGGVYVDRAMEELLKHKLADSSYGDSEFIAVMTRQFEQKIKRVYDGHQVSNVINFGMSRDNDKNHGIIKGKLTLSRDEVGAAYTAVISHITNSCRSLLKDREVQHLLLVGGFGESPYLRSQLKHAFGEGGTQVVTIDEPSKKAAADGAVIWYLTQLVEARAARFDYGFVSGRLYDNEKDGIYKDKVFLYGDGEHRLWEFDILIPKDTVFNDQMTFTSQKQGSYSEPPIPGSMRMNLSITVWRGNGPAPRVLDPYEGPLECKAKHVPGLDDLCSVRADFSSLYASAKPRVNQRTGMRFWIVQLYYDIFFRNMRLMARIRWNEKGVERIGPATIIPVTKL